jgi:sulfur-oxidizing protein SoxY
MRSRRRFVSLLAGIAALPLARARAARAQPDPFAGLVRELTGGAPVRAGRVAIDIPRLADNGHSVPIRVSVESPMTAADHVRSIVLLSGRNPRPLMARFHLGPASGRAAVATRVRLNGTQEVLALAQLSDGSYWSARAEVEVTESACLDMS